MWVTRHYEDAWWSMIVYIATAPGLIVLFPAIAVYSMIYVAAYPDRHANAIDFYGTDDAKRLLNDYRAACNERSFFRRLLEGLHFCRYTGPEYPAYFDQEIQRPRGDQDAQAIVERSG